jgi:hypothetical protein
MTAIVASSPGDLSRKRRKLTQRDIEDIAKLLAKRVTETGACLLLGIRPQTWMNWKAKHKNTSKFKEVFERVREAKINAVIDQIDEAGDKRTYVNKKGEVVECSGDWRAKAWIAERVLAPERFADKRNDTAPAQPTINVNIFTELARQVYGQAVIEVKPEAKALPPASELAP